MDALKDQFHEELSHVRTKTHVPSMLSGLVRLLTILQPRFDKLINTYKEALVLYIPVDTLTNVILDYSCGVF